MAKRLLLILLLIAAVPLSAATTSRYIVATRHGVRASALRSIRGNSESSDFGDRAVRSFAVIDAFAADLTDSEVVALKQSSDVRYVSRTVERHIDDAPLQQKSNESPYLLHQTVPYGIDLVHARDVWTVTKGRGNVNVATIDTGIDYQHLDLGPHYAGGYNVLKKTNDPMDDNKHGTHVAGIIGALDNTFGVVGVAPEAKIWAVKVLDASGKGSDETIVAGVDWLIAKKREIGGNWILSLSLGSREPSDIEGEAFRQAADEGMLIVAAAGNDSSSTLSFPAAYPTVFSVGAVDSKSVRPAFSNGGTTLGVVAPGVDVLSTVPTGSAPAATLVTDGGTSYTALQVTGSALRDITAPFIGCGLGQPADFPPGIQGRIAVMQRGTITFSEKVRNAKAAGAIAAVIYNNVDGDTRGWTLIRPDCSPTACTPYAPDVTFDWPATVSIDTADGEALLKSNARTLTLSTWADDYGVLSGTSMATPHVTGVAALLWTLAPSATASQIHDAITSTAHDLGQPGYDPLYGFGLVDALAAAKQIAPAAFGLPLPPPAPGRRRDVPH